VSTRYRILRELKIFHSEYPNSWLAATDMAAFRSDARSFAEAIEKLRAEQLVLSIAGEDGAGVRLNPDKLREVNSEIVRQWRHWLALLLAAVAGIAAFLALRSN